MSLSSLSLLEQATKRNIVHMTIMINELYFWNISSPHYYSESNRQINARLPFKIFYQLEYESDLIYCLFTSSSVKNEVV